MTWAVTAMVAAAALTAYNTKETARKQDRAVSQGILARMQSTRDQSDAMQKTLAQLRDSNAQPAVAQANTDYLRALGAPRPGGTASQPATVGAMSDAYRQAAGAAANDSTALADKTAGLMALTDAPGIQRQGESAQIGQLSAALGRIGISANDATNLAQLKARGIRPNPWIGLAASALSAYGSGAAGAAGSAGSTGSTNSYSLAGYGGNGGGGAQSYLGDGSLNGTYNQNAGSLFGSGKTLYGS